MVVTVEREDVELRKSKVCRKLFVDSDDECVATNDKQDLKVELDNNFNSLLQKKIEKWNFDFVKGLPLKGRYNWTPVIRDLENSATSTVNFETSGKLRNKMNRKGSFHPYKNQQKKSHQTILHGKCEMYFKFIWVISIVKIESLAACFLKNVYKVTR